jgi:hypothetical protein
LTLPLPLPLPLPLLRSMGLNFWRAADIRRPGFDRAICWV